MWCAIRRHVSCAGRTFGILHVFLVLIGFVFAFLAFAWFYYILFGSSAFPQEAQLWFLKMRNHICASAAYASTKSVIVLPEKVKKSYAFQKGETHSLCFSKRKWEQLCFSKKEKHNLYFHKKESTTCIPKMEKHNLCFREKHNCTSKKVKNTTGIMGYFL